ncbi:Hypothetical predicted protein [Marmota monax]|uniref:Uncharacterized protein n=1 Tax=Marmota monax TaxID=9995 RepID=A0A5E4BXK0_MARMO|nr:hypothetical protein GHT09_007321 [Marmota monax]VTJ73710.1 Hypothetical predicted protein [Marmota monax]
MGAASDAGSPPAFSPPRPGSASFRVGGRRRGGRTEHAQLGGRTAEELAASAAGAPIRLSGFSQPQSAQPAGPGARAGRGVNLGEGEGALGTPSRPQAAPSAPTSLEVAVTVAWTGNLTCAERADGVGGGDPLGEMVIQPARAPRLLRGVGTEMLGHLPQALRDQSLRGGPGLSSGTPREDAPALGQE